MTEKNKRLMQRRFTLRIEEKESKELEKLQELLKKNTDTGVIKYLINSYHSLNEKYEEERKKTVRLEREKEEMKIKINSFLLALQNLKTKEETL